MQKKIRALQVVCLASIAFFLALVFAGTSPSINLLSPENGAVFNTTNNINFSCNAATNAALRKIDIYTTLNGSFSKTNASCFGELCEGSSTALLFHFNNNSLAGENGTLVYDWSGNGNNATVYGAQFNATGGKFGGVFEFNGSGTQYMSIKSSDGANLAASGSIEFWVNRAELDSGDRYIFVKTATDSCTVQPAYVMKLRDDHLLELDLNGDPYIAGYGDPYVSTLPIAFGNWSHAVYTWNGSSVEIYINGVHDISSPQLHSISPNNYNLWIGSMDDTNCYLNNNGYGAFFTGAIDELALYNRALSASEVSEHYNRTIVNNATKNWTISNVSDGTYSWTCRAEDNESLSAWGANRTFFVDLHTPPSVNWIMLSPNETDVITAGDTVNVTANITDISNVSTAIFQYTTPLGATKPPITMTYNGSDKTYRASFIPDDRGMWKYKIWANDTFGHAGTNNETNLSVLDYTWRLSVINISGSYSRDFGTISAPNGTPANIGTIAIKNTGNFLLHFDVSYTPANINLQDNMSGSFDVNPKNTTFVEITAITPNEIYEWPILLIINTSALATPTSATVSGTLVPFRGGPYLDAVVLGYQPTASHSQEVNLSAKTKNLGNETATGVWLNWTLPDGWTILAGNKSAYLENITSGSTGWNNVTVKISPTNASPGSYEIFATAASLQNITKTSEYKTVSVICRKSSDGVCGLGCAYTNDDDCPQPTTTTGGTSGTSAPSATGGGTASAKYYGIVLGAPDKIDASRGSPVRFAINITNLNKDTRIENITYSLSGYSQALTFGEPKIISAVSYGETKTILFRLEVPNYTRYGEYPLEATAYGRGTSSGIENATGVSASRKLTLVVRSATENETLSILDAASKSIEPLAALNINMPGILQMLESARASLKEWNYDAAKELAGKALEAGQSAIKSYGSLRQVESAISEADKYGVDASETKKMYSLAEAAFERGDYARAEERANNAMLAAAIEVSAKVSIYKFSHTYYREIILASILLAVSMFFIYRKISAGIIKREISILEKEEEAIRNLIAGAKKNYFEKKAITKAEYKKAIYGYETRMNEIKKERSQKILRLAGIARPEKVIDGFRKEEKRILGLIEAAQKDYFELGKISKAHYHGTMHELNAELAEVRLGIELAGQKAGKNKPIASALILAALSFLLIGAGAHAAIDAAGAADAINQAESDIIDMQKSGFGIALANDTLNEARILYSKKNYAGAESLAKYVGSIKKTAISTRALVDDAEEKIFEAKKEGLGVSGAKKDFDAGLLALENSDYLEAEELLNSALAKADNALADSAMKGALGRSWLSDAKNYALQKKKQIAMILVLMALLFSAAKKKYNSMKRAKHILRLEGEEKAAAKMIQELQKKYFLDGAVGKAEYASRVRRYGEIILQAKKDISVLKGAEKRGKP